MLDLRGPTVKEDDPTEMWLKEMYSGKCHFGVKEKVKFQSVADLGFPRRGPNPGVPTYYLAFFHENCTKMKKSLVREGVSLSLPGNDSSLALRGVFVK